MTPCAAARPAMGGGRENGCEIPPERVLCMQIPAITRLPRRVTTRVHALPGVPCEGWVKPAKFAHYKRKGRIGEAGRQDRHAPGRAC